MSTIPEIQDSEFNTLINNGTLVVVDFMLSWCGPCRKVNRLMDRLAEEYADKTTVVKIDTEQSKSTAKKFDVSRIPAVLMFKDGELVETIVGVKPYGTFTDAVTKHLRSDL